MLSKFIRKLALKVIQGEEVSAEDAPILFAAEGGPARRSRVSGGDLYDLLYWANKIRQTFKGNKISLCAILAAKLGACQEDCKFCAQSAHYKTHLKAHPLVSPEEMAKVASRVPSAASSFGIVTSGNCLEKSELLCVGSAIEKIAEGGKLNTCASFGRLRLEQALFLKEKGLVRYNHNLETSRHYFPQICSTHTYEERLATVKAARQAGLEVCSGGIFGVGESVEDRCEMALALRELDVDSIPLNFLHPIPGTPLAGVQPLEPLEILRLIAAFRFILPGKDIKVAGGREVNLRGLQSWMYYAGASGAIIGDYLTTEGLEPAEDLCLIADLGLEVQMNSRAGRLPTASTPLETARTKG